MPPRHTYWTIIFGGQPTSFRSATPEELLPTFKQIQSKHPDALMMWFARGKLWKSPEEEREHRERARRPKWGRPPRRDDSGHGPRHVWKPPPAGDAPGGEYRGPRDEGREARDERRGARGEGRGARPQGQGARREARGASGEWRGERREERGARGGQRWSGGEPKPRESGRPIGERWKPAPPADSAKRETRSSTPAFRAPKPEARSLKPGARSPQPEARSPKPGARGPNPGARSPKPAARSPKPGARAPEPENRGRSWRPGGQHKDPRDRFKVPRDVKRKRMAVKFGWKKKKEEDK